MERRSCCRHGVPRELDLADGEDVALGVLGLRFSRLGVEPSKEFRDVRPVHRLTHVARSVEVQVDPQVVRDLEQHLGPALLAPLCSLVGDPGAPERLEMELGRAEPDIQPAGELRGREGLGPQQAHYANPGGVSEGSHRGESADADWLIEGGLPLLPF